MIHFDIFPKNRYSSLNMKRLMILFFSFVFSILAFALVGDFCQKQTKGFCLQKIISKNQERQKENPLSSDELASIQKILTQPFYFMKKGQQCYAFVSQDGQYVLKFFRWSQMEAPFWTQILPEKWSQKIRQEKQEKQIHDLTSYKLAFKELKEETGLIYLHLQKTDFLKTSLCFYDAIDIQYLIESDKIEFVLQKKADLFSSYLEKNKDHPEKLKSFFSEFSLLLSSRFQKQICDSDISLEHNMGVLDGKPLLFDIGNLKKGIDPSLSLEKFMEIESTLVLQTLQRENPSLAIFLQKKIEDLSLEPF